MNYQYREEIERKRRMLRIYITLITVQVLASIAIIVYFSTQGV